MAIPWLDTDRPEGLRNDLIIDRAPRPTNVYVTRISPSAFKVTWDALNFPSQIHGGHSQYILAGNWEIRMCPASLAGDSGDPNFATRCLELSTVIATATHPGTIVISDETIGNVYILVVGVSPISGHLGVPSKPQLLDNNGPIVFGPGGNVTSFSLALSPTLGGTRLTYQWRAPSASSFGGFGGVHLHAVGYQGDGTLREMGSFIPYPFNLQPSRRVRGSQVFASDNTSTTVYAVSVGRDGSRIDDVVGSSPNTLVATGITA